MSVTVQEQRELRQIGRQLAAQGIEGGLEFSRINEKRQWYRADGTPLPTLLPIDDYHMQRYKDKGWTLVPPQGGVKDQVKGPSLIEQELERNRLAAEKKANKGQKLSPIEAEVQREIAGKVEDERRRAGVVDAPDGLNFLTEEAPAKPEGLPCEQPGCDYVAQGKTERLRKARMQNHTYGPRSKHKKEKQDGWNNR